MSATADIKETVKIESISISVNDKRANSGEGGYRFGKILFDFNNNGLTLWIRGNDELYKLIKMKKMSELPK